MLIGHLAASSGTSAKTVRFYETVARLDSHPPWACRRRRLRSVRFLQLRDAGRAQCQLPVTRGAAITSPRACTTYRGVRTEFRVG